MMTKKLIWRDRHAESQFLTGLETARDRANEFIDTFNNLQPWEKIGALEDFEALVASPEAYYDRAMMRNMNPQPMGTAKPNPEQLAKLYDIPREAYLAIVRGVYMDAEGCTPCRKVRRIRKGKPCISPEEYRKYSPFLLFSSGLFTINEETVARNSERFCTYAETSGQMELVNHFETLVTVLNTQDELYPIPSKIKQGMAQAMGLQLSQGMDGSFLLDNDNLRNLIYKR